jgi:hypothetical protein
MQDIVTSHTANYGLHGRHSINLRRWPTGSPDLNQRFFLFFCEVLPLYDICAHKRTVPAPGTSPLTSLITRWVSRTRSVASADLHLNHVTAQLFTLFKTTQSVITSRLNHTLQTLSIHRKICIYIAFFL